jgi:hypothetical protein
MGLINYKQVSEMYSNPLSIQHNQPDNTGIFRVHKKTPVRHSPKGVLISIEVRSYMIFYDPDSD